jgi:hypothetical protein
VLTLAFNSFRRTAATSAHGKTTSPTMGHIVNFRCGRFGNQDLSLVFLFHHLYFRSFTFPLTCVGPAGTKHTGSAFIASALSSALVAVSILEEKKTVSASLSTKAKFMSGGGIVAMTASHVTVSRSFTCSYRFSQPCFVIFFTISFFSFITGARSSVGFNAGAIALVVAVAAALLSTSSLWLH